MKHLARWLLLLALLVPAGAAAQNDLPPNGPPFPTTLPTPVPAAPLAGTPMCFPPTGYCLHGPFLLYWRLHGGLAQFGYPVTPELTEGGATVQYTERARFELHGDTGLLGLLGRELTAGRADAPFHAVAAAPGATFFAPTGHNLAPPFRAAWQAQGGLPVVGYPISEAFAERNPTDGQTYQAQYFERARLEFHPAQGAAPAAVLGGLLGVQAYTARYGSSPPLHPDPRPAPDPVSLAALRQAPRQCSDLRTTGVLARAAAYTEYSITYRSAGRRISGVMYMPAGRGPFPVIIMAHGYIPIAQYSTGMDSRRESPYLASHGYVAIHPDFRNYAGSDDDPEAEADTTTFGWTQDTLNLVVAIQQSALPALDARRIGFWGHSNGGQVGLQTMSLDTSIKGYVLFAPTSPDYADNYNRWMRNDADGDAVAAKHGTPESNPAFFHGVSSGPWFDQVAAPVLLFHGTGDTNTPYEWSVRTAALLRAAGKDVTFVSPPGENHLFSSAAFATVGPQMLAFFDRTVKAAP